MWASVLCVTEPCLPISTELDGLNNPFYFSNRALTLYILLSSHTSLLCSVLDAVASGRSAGWGSQSLTAPRQCSCYLGATSGLDRCSHDASGAPNTPRCHTLHPCHTPCTSHFSRCMLGYHRVPSNLTTSQPRLSELPAKPCQGRIWVRKNYCTSTESTL